MILLFVENRYATRLAYEVATRLVGDGHEIHWIVQNPIFAPRTGSVHVIPFPVRSRGLTPPDWTAAFARVASTDRQILHFGLGNSHYPHYLRHIEQIVDLVSPGIVFGESTQFYELLTIEVCRRRKIPYLFPVTTGYPRNRVSFFAFDTRYPVGGDGSHLDGTSADKMIQDINQRKLAPSYMSSPSTSRWAARLGKIADRTRILSGWLAGERFATPSPLRKYWVNRSHARLRRDWDNLAASKPRGQGPYILYPLQLQPECAIDVWGWPWRNQAEIIQRAARALAGIGYQLVVKPNPKSKYEITRDLLDAIGKFPNIIPILHKTPMSEVFSGAEGVLSVTGTALIEAVFAGKQAICLGNHAMSRYPGIRSISTPEGIADLVVRTSISPNGSAIEPARLLLDWLQTTSYEGEVFDPLLERSKLRGKSVEELTRAFKHVIAGLSRGSIVICC
jgi:hypothetical protein